MKTAKNVVVGRIFAVIVAASPALASDPQTRTGRIAQAIAAPIAYVVWVIALGGPFQYQAQQPGSPLTYNKALASVLLILVSALSNLGLPTRSTVVDRLSDPEKARLTEVFHLRKALGE